MTSARGFTLIELLVTITIVVLVTGISISAYLTFNESRQIDVDARDFLSTLNRIRSKAVFLEYPEDCTGLAGYTVEIVPGVSGSLDSLKYFANCSEGRRGETTAQILNSSVFESAKTINFLPISGAIDFGQDVSIVISLVKGSTRSKTITISQAMDTNNTVIDN